MPIDDKGRWHPDLFDRQYEIFNSLARALLVCGPRKSGKTWGVLHKIVRHLWETPGARVAMFSKTMKNSKDGGTWDDMHKIVLPEWFAAGIGMRYTTLNGEGKPGWKVDGQTRTPFFRITNMYGGESELKLFSLDVDAAMEDKVKEQRFSMIYFSELSKFTDRKVLTIALPQLRMPHLKMNQQQWIADTNPGEEGDQSWIYEVWYRERKMTYEEYQKSRNGLPCMKEQTFLSYQKGLQLIEIRPEENPHLPDEELEELKATYAYDQGLYARYVEGQWVYGDGDASRHFRGVFNRAVHVAGDVSDPDEDKWTYLNPSELCFELITGWDPGETNHAAAVLEKMIHEEKPYFRLLDEVVLIKGEVSIEEFTQLVMEKVEALDEQCKKQTNNRPLLTDHCWSDRSAIEKYSSSADTYPYLEILSASNDRFFLRGVPKPDGSVRLRVRLIKKLLVQRRLLVSAHCTFAIAMFEKLKRGNVEFVVEDEHKHIFDALSYAILMECMEELDNARHPTVGGRPISTDIEVRL